MKNVSDNLNSKKKLYGKSLKKMSDIETEIGSCIEVNEKWFKEWKNFMEIGMSWSSSKIKVSPIAALNSENQEDIDKMITLLGKTVGDMNIYSKLFSKTVKHNHSFDNDFKKHIKRYNAFQKKFKSVSDDNTEKIKTFGNLLDEIVSHKTEMEICYKTMKALTKPLYIIRGRVNLLKGVN